MTFTEHYGLAQPGETDPYDICQMNENMETIDGVMAAQEENIGQMNEKMGTPADTGADTLFGKLNQIQTNTAGGGAGLTAIKSIQSILTPNLQNTETKALSIQTVDPSKCICILERVQDNSTITQRLDYTLEAEKVTFSTQGLNYPFVVRLWIIEFM